MKDGDLGILLWGCGITWYALTSGVMWLFDLDDFAKTGTIVAIAEVIIAILIFFGVNQYENLEKEKLERKKLLERRIIVEEEKLKEIKKTKSKSRDYTKRKSKKSSKPFKTSSVTYEEKPTYSQDTYSKKDLASAGFKVVKKAKD